MAQVSNELKWNASAREPPIPTECNFNNVSLQTNTAFPKLIAKESLEILKPYTNRLKIILGWNWFHYKPTPRSLNFTNRFR